jgi:hypothetical protein
MQCPKIPEQPAKQPWKAQSKPSKQPFVTQAFAPPSSPLLETPLLELVVPLLETPLLEPDPLLEPLAPDELPPSSPEVASSPLAASSPVSPPSPLASSEPYPESSPVGFWYVPPLVLPLPPPLLPVSVPEEEPEDEPEEDDEVLAFVGWFVPSFPVSDVEPAEEHATAAIAMQLANTQMPARFVAIGPIDPSTPTGAWGRRSLNDGAHRRYRRERPNRCQFWPPALWAA